MPTDDEAQRLIVALLDRVREFAGSLTEQEIDDLLSGRASLTLSDVDPAEQKP